MKSRVSVVVAVVLSMGTSLDARTQDIPIHSTPESVIQTLYAASGSCNFGSLADLMPPTQRIKIVLLWDNVEKMNRACEAGQGDPAAIMRELRIMATLAKDMEPAYEEQGAIAVYDLSARLKALGEKADSIRLIRYENAWWLSPDKVGLD